jgi:hypothetical protein
MKCRCRNCQSVYEESKSRAEWKGYCSAKCQHEKAKALGYRKKKGSHEYDVLKRHGEIGSVFA